MTLKTIKFEDYIINLDKKSISKIDINNPFPETHSTISKVGAINFLKSNFDKFVHFDKKLGHKRS